MVDIGLGGVRVFSDEPFRVGERLEVELFLPDGESVECLAEVMWLRTPPAGTPAQYDVGLMFLDLPDPTRVRLSEVVVED